MKCYRNKLENEQTEETRAKALVFLLSNQTKLYIDIR